MFELKQKLSGGQLVDFTAALRDYKPRTFAGDVRQLPDPEFCIVAAQAANRAGWFEVKMEHDDLVQKLRDLDGPDLITLGYDIQELFAQWSRRRDVTDEEKKGSSGTLPTS